MAILYLMLNQAQRELRQAVERFKDDNSTENLEALVDSYMEAVRTVQVIESQIN